MTVIGAGVTLHEALAAADLLKRGKECGTCRVLDGALTCRPGLGYGKNPGPEPPHVISCALSDPAQLQIDHILCFQLSRD